LLITNWASQKADLALTAGAFVSPETRNWAKTQADGLWIITRTGKKPLLYILNAVFRHNRYKTYNQYHPTSGFLYC